MGEWVLFAFDGVFWFFCAVEVVGLVWLVWCGVVWFALLFCWSVGIMEFERVSERFAV